MINRNLNGKYRENHVTVKQKILLESIISHIMMNDSVFTKTLHIDDNLNNIYRPSTYSTISCKFFTISIETDRSRSFSIDIERKTLTVSSTYFDNYELREETTNFPINEFYFKQLCILIGEFLIQRVRSSVNICMNFM